MVDVVRSGSEPGDVKEEMREPLCSNQQSPEKSEIPDGRGIQTDGDEGGGNLKWSNVAGRVLMRPASLGDYVDNLRCRGLSSLSQVSPLPLCASRMKV